MISVISAKWWKRQPGNVDEDILIYSIIPNEVVVPASPILLKSLPVSIAGIWSEDNASQLKATNALRRLVSAVYAPSNVAVIKVGVLPRLVTFLSRDDFPELQFKAAWVLTNIASGTSKDKKAIVESSAVPILIQLLSSASEDVRQVATWALRNVSGDLPKYRMIPLMSQIFSELSTIPVPKNYTLTFSDFCKGNPPKPSHEQPRPALPVLDDINSESPLVSQGCIKLICDLLTCPDPKIITVCLEALENILMIGEAEKNLGHTRDDNLYVSMIQEAQGLEKIENLQRHDNNEIYQKAAKILETYWTEDDDKEGNDENLAPFGFVLV